MLVCRTKLFSNDKKIYVDFGENENLLQGFDQNLLQQTAKVSSLHNNIDALNYMASLGWQVVHITPFVTDGDGGTFDTFRYLMKRVTN